MGRKSAWHSFAGLLAALPFLIFQGGCAGPAGAAKAIVKSSTAAKPDSLGLLYPQVEPGSADGKGEWPNDRKVMASEMAAIVHVQVRDRLAEHVPPAKDLSADKMAKPRTAMLGASIHREYSLNGSIPVARANELGKVADAEACLLVSVIKFGPSRDKLQLKSIGGLIKPVKTDEAAKTWINCGVVVVVFKTPGGQVLWEAGHLASLNGETHTQEQAAEQCMKDLFASCPWP